MLRRFTDVLHITNADEVVEEETSSSMYESHENRPKRKKKRLRIKTRSGRKPPKARLRGAIVPFLERWVMTTMRHHGVSQKKSLNQVFAPIPTICALYAVMQALPKKKRQHLREKYELNMDCVQELRNSVASQPKLLPSAMFSFVKIIVDDDENTVVSAGFMRKLKELTQSEVVLACSPQRMGRFLRALTGGAIDGPRSSHGFSCIYATAGLRAQWCGKATSASPSAFASTYSIRQKHPYFCLEAEAKVLRMHHCEIWEVPVTAAKLAFSLVLIRPIFIGELQQLKSLLTGDDLKDILSELVKTEGKHHKLLLPVFSIVSEENMLQAWLKNASAKILGENPVIPPIDAIWNVAKFSINVDGIGVKDFKLGDNPHLPTSLRSYRTDDDLWRPHERYTTSIDSSFLFVVTRNGVVPLLAGCYAGTPAPPATAFSMSCPQEIVDKPPPKVIKKAKPKLTKRQKKVEKIRRKRAAKLKRREQMLVERLMGRRSE